MKKTLLTTSLIFSCVVFLIAQENKMNVGITIGPSIIRAHGAGVNSKFAKSAIGFSAGLSFEYLFSENLSFFTAAQYEKKGYAYHFIFTDNKGTILKEENYPINYNYLTFPLLTRYYIHIGSKTTLYVNAGPYIGLLISQISIFPIMNGDETIRGNYTKYSKTFDLGPSIGLGGILPISDKIDIEYELRENYGLLNTDKTSSSYPLKTNSVNLLVNFKYKI